MQILAFQNMELERKSFSAMPPHMQTELVLLAMERGSSVMLLASKLGLHHFDVVQIARARHLYNLPSIGVSPFDDKPAAVRQDEKRADKIDIDGLVISRSQASVLRWIAGGKNGQVSALRANMAEAVKLPIKSLDSALLRLLDDGLIARLRVASKAKPALWAVTKAGLALLASLENGEAA